VSTSGRVDPSSFSAQPSKAFNPSASSTTATFAALTTARTNCTVSALRETPGPTASTSLVEAIPSKRPYSSARIEIDPASVSARGSVITSGANPATVANTDFGVATVASPAPTRKADIPAIAAAPAFPTDPPTTSTCPKFPL
jgi:hypothetical protein